MLRALWIGLAAALLWMSGAHAQTTIFTGIVTQDNPAPNYTMIVETTSPALTGPSQGLLNISVAAGPAGGSAQVDDAYVCASTGASPSCVGGTRVQLKKAGSGSFTIAQGATVVLDQATFPSVSTDLVFCFDLNTSAGNLGYSAATGSAGMTIWYKTPAASACASDTRSGFSTLANETVGVALVTTQPGSGGGTVHRSTMSLMRVQ
jgi:hypothetical protein